MIYWITIKLLQFRIKRAKVNKLKYDIIIQQAYDDMIQAYANTISFIKAEQISSRWENLTNQNRRVVDY